MIFFTVGTQLPFDRLGEAVEHLARAWPELSFIGQVGHTKVVHTAVVAQPFMTQQEYEQALDACTVVVAHAGTGTIMAALKRGKPVMVVPRLGSLREARSEHQLATCRAFEGAPGVHVLMDPGGLEDGLREVLDQPRHTSNVPLRPSRELLQLRQALDAAIYEEAPKRGTRSTYRILACSSGGGHLSELSELLEPDARLDTIFASSGPGDRDRCAPLRHFRLRECSRSAPWMALLGAIEALMLVWRLRPDVVLTTGALPGLLCLCWARVIGARAVWVDSLANAEEVSLSGRLARPLATHFFVQWPGLAAGQARYCGRVT